MGLGAFRAAVGVAVLPHDGSWADLSLRMVVARGDVGMVQEREQLVLMPPQSLDQATRMWLVPSLSQQIVQPLPPHRESLGRQFAMSLVEANRAADQPLQLFGELRPVATGPMVALGRLQISLQERRHFCFGA
jgi:hypothetical protein